MDSLENMSVRFEIASMMKKYSSALVASSTAKY